MKKELKHNQDVLFRDHKDETWRKGFFDKYWGGVGFPSEYKYWIQGTITRYCIPYKGNEELLFKTGDPKNDPEQE